MKIKSLFVTAVLTTAVLCFGGVAAAQTPTIAQLMAQIAQLQAQLQTLMAQQGTAALATPTIVVSSTTPAQYIVAGPNASQATFNFISNGGASTITELKFSTINSAVANVCAGSICAQPVAGVADLTGLNIAVPNDGAGLNLKVLISYAGVGMGGLQSGTTSVVSLFYVKYTAGGITSTISPNVNAPIITLVGSLPTVSVGPGNPSSALMLGAQNQIGQVTVAASPQGAVKVNTITFDISSSGINSFGLSNPILSASAPIVGASCVATVGNVVCTLGNSYAADFLIPAGMAQTFNLSAQVGGSVSLGANPALSSSISSTGFIWDDTSANGASGTGLTGSLINLFPTNSYTIGQPIVPVQPSITVKSIFLDESNNVHFIFFQIASSCLQLKTSQGIYFSLTSASAYPSYSCANSTLFSGYQTELVVPHDDFAKPINVGDSYRVCNADTRGDSYDTCSSPITVSPSPIKITGVQFSPSSPKVNDLVTASVTIQNRSSLDYNIPFQVDASGSTATVNSLATGASQTVSIASFSFAQAGTFPIVTSIIYPLPGLTGQGSVGFSLTKNITFSPSTPVSPTCGWCDAWSDCVNGQQTRSCNSLFGASCPKTQSCTVQPSITVTSPNGGETVLVGAGGGVQTILGQHGLHPTCLATLRYTLILQMGELACWAPHPFPRDTF